MRKLILILMLAFCHTGFSEPQDSIKTYNKGDLIITAGGTSFGLGLCTLVFSRHISIGLLTAGGITTVVGVLVRHNQKKKWQQEKQ